MKSKGFFTWKAAERVIRSLLDDEDFYDVFNMMKIQAHLLRAMFDATRFGLNLSPIKVITEAIVTFGADIVHDLVVFLLDYSRAEVMRALNAVLSKEEIESIFGGVIRQ